MAGAEPPVTVTHLVQLVAAFTVTPCCRWGGGATLTPGPRLLPAPVTAQAAMNVCCVYVWQVCDGAVAAGRRLPPAPAAAVTPLVADGGCVGMWGGGGERRV